MPDTGRCYKVTEATALGAAIVAGVGAGVYTSIVKAAEDLVVGIKSIYQIVRILVNTRRSKINGRKCMKISWGLWIED